MRTISTDGLKPLRPDGLGPWRLGDDLLLRTSSNGRSLQTESEARAVFGSYRAARLAGAGSPTPVEVVRSGDGYGVVVEYVRGCGIGLHILIGSYTPEEAGRKMAAVLRRFHAARTDEGRDWNDAFRWRSHALSGLLPREAGERLLSLVDAMPASNTLLLGDMHFGNLIVRGGEIVPIDMESVGFGHPALDLAIARSRLLFKMPSEAERIGASKNLGERASRSVWNALLGTYFAGAAADEIAGLERRLAILSEVEDCCYEHGMGHVGASGPSAAQRERLVLCARRLEALLPRVESLAF